MILKELYLYPDLVEFDDDVVHPFRDQSRSICNYLERHIKPLKFDAKGFKRICFIGKKEPSQECFINSSKVLIVEIYLDEKRYINTAKAGLNFFFSKMLEAGIEKCQKQYEIPENELLDGLVSFRENGYVNKWEFKSKKIKSFDVKCILECELTTDAFHLTLKAVKGEREVFKREILETVPDEIVFAPKFKDIIINGDNLVILDKFGDMLYSLKLREMNIN